MANGLDQEQEMDEGSDHREISVAEFFEKNKHLLGFENAQKSIITVVKEAVDNSLDACEEDEILPEIHVLIDEIDDKNAELKSETTLSDWTERQFQRFSVSFSTGQSSTSYNNLVDSRELEFQHPLCMLNLLQESL